MATTTPYDYLDQAIVATALIEPKDIDSFYNPDSQGHIGYAYDGKFYYDGVVFTPPVVAISVNNNIATYYLTENHFSDGQLVTVAGIQPTVTTALKAVSLQSNVATFFLNSNSFLTGQTVTIAGVTDQHYAITQVQVQSNIAVFTATNSLKAGHTVVVSGLTGALAYLNGTYTVLGSSPVGFSVSVVSSNVSLTNTSGLATLPMTFFNITGTITSVDTFNVNFTMALTHADFPQVPVTVGGVQVTGMDVFNTSGTVQNATATSFDLPLTHANMPMTGIGAGGSVTTVASWATEAAGAYRGTLATFPAAGLILLSNAALSILDETTSALTLWMQFLMRDDYALANNFALGNPNYLSGTELQGFQPRGLAYSDGVISVVYNPDPGSISVYSTMVVHLDFTQDKIYLDVAV